MPRRSSSQLANAASKRVQKDATTVMDDVGQSAEFIKSKQGEQQSQPGKRQRTANQLVKPAIDETHVGKLGGLANLPTEVFTEIASHLWPLDIINLTRSSKSFRSLLLNRSSIHIWQKAANNVPGLPGCPPDMNLPRYLAFMFVETCTSCGEGEHMEVDTILRVRLCVPCRQSCLIPWNDVPPDIMPIIAHSAEIAPIPRRSNAYSLQYDVLSLVAEYEEKKGLNNARAFHVWAAKKRRLVNTRFMYAYKMRKFLKAMDLVREQKMDDIKAERKEEIKHWLEELGWTREDMNFSYRGCLHQAEWLQLVSQPKPLTEREWTDLEPQLIPLLKANRERRLYVQYQKRQDDRRGRLAELLRAIKQQDGFTVQMPTQHPATLVSGSLLTASYEPPFPELSYMLDCPVVLDLYETDRTATELEAKFEQHRIEIERYITEWKARIQTHCSKLARQGLKNTKNILQSSLVASDNQPNPFANLSDDIKLLLRADSFFITTAQFYSERPVTYGSVLKFEGLLGTYTALGAAIPKAPPSLDGISWNDKAHNAAQDLLACLGLPDVSYLEMTDKSVYTCGRCHDTENKTWEEMVYHYVQQKQKYARIRKETWLTKEVIVYKDVHDPAQFTRLPLIRYSGVQATEVEQYECKVCAEAVILGEVIASEEKLMQHLANVHGITDPISDEHYAPQIAEESESQSSESGCDDLDEMCEGGCDYTRDLHLYCEHDRRRNKHQNYRLRCYFDGEGDEE
ncbi:unnamed protein product [Rhizoctonia solani]|nr:unnamed protein product [Rhizoctonia solani]